MGTGGQSLASVVGAVGSVRRVGGLSLPDLRRRKRDTLSDRPWMFGDEWQRGRRYGLVLVCATDPQQLVVVRRALRGLRLPGENRFHMPGERPARRKAALSLLARLPVRGYVTETTGHPVNAREECLRRVPALLATLNAARLTLERQDEGQQARDRRCLAQLLVQGKGPHDLSYEHADPNLEPMLWAADIVAWAVGKRGDWRRRAAGTIESIF